MKIRLFAITLLIAVLAVASSARAELLSALLGGGSIQVGDKLFDQFGYLHLGDMPDAGGVNVVGYTDDQGNFGLKFQGAFLDYIGGSGSDALIEFRVTALDPNKLITGVTLAGNPNVIGGTGVMSITETFLPDSPASLSIYDIEPGATKLVDSVDFLQGFRSLHVQKDILAFAATGIPTLSHFTQTFRQTAVPEPSTVALSLVGLVGLVAWRARQQKGR